MRGLFNVLQILKENTGCDNSSYYADVKTKIYKLFNKYESLVQLGLKGLHSLQAIHVKNRYREESLEVLDHLVLLVLPLPLSPIHLYLLLLLLVSSQLTWTVTMSLHMRMTLIYFSGGVNTN